MEREDINSYFSKYFVLYGTGFPVDGAQDGCRKAAKTAFLEEGIPDRSLEEWRHFPWERVLCRNYRMRIQPEAYQPLESFFHCSTEGIHAEMFPFLNGWYMHCNAPLTRFPNGLVVGSLREASRLYPDMVFPHLYQIAGQSDGMVHFNHALWQDGLFVYVPDHVTVHHPIQLVNLVKADEELLVQPHHLIVLGEGASLKLVHCDESLADRASLTNTVIEIRVGPHARFDYYKLENQDNLSVMMNHLFVSQQEGSEVNTHTHLFNGGVVHNSIRMDLCGSHARANNNGLYLADGTQHVTNAVMVRHHATDCVSNQLYKGILDAEARAEFMGYVQVDKDAQRTEAHQINRNMLLKDTVRVNSKPFLEIYADDVQCTHGATVGQLDEDAVFYLRSRGICERNARLLLMHAFTREVIDKMDIPALCERFENLVTMRLSGENIQCGECTRCSREVTFEVVAPEL